jgi:nucleoside-diphosphate-sugar epimerase
MRVVVVGATGNVGTSVVRRLAANDAVTEVVGIARRLPHIGAIDEPGVRRVAADIERDDLVDLFEGADAVVDLAWSIQPVRTNNACGGPTSMAHVVWSPRPSPHTYRRSCTAVRRHYARGPKDRAVDESWPATGISTSLYSRHKAEIEAFLELSRHRSSGSSGSARRSCSNVQRPPRSPDCSSVRSHRHDRSATTPARIPDVDRLSFQVVHADDAAAAYEARR